MHKHKKYTYAVKLFYGAIRFLLCMKLRTLCWKNWGVKTPYVKNFWGDKTLLAIQRCETLSEQANAEFEFPQDYAVWWSFLAPSSKDMVKVFVFLKMKYENLDWIHESF